MERRLDDARGLRRSADLDRELRSHAGERRLDVRHGDVPVNGRAVGAELLLRVRGDADAHPVAFRFRPLVLARVLEIFGDVGHGYAFFTREGWNGVLTTRAAFAAPRTSTASSVPTPASGASTYAMAMYLSTDGP